MAGFETLAKGDHDVLIVRLSIGGGGDAEARDKVFVGADAGAGQADLRRSPLGGWVVATACFGLRLGDTPLLDYRTAAERGLGHEQAMALLRLNENLYFARFGIWESSTDVMIVASMDAILESLDAAEILAYANYLSHAADEYEAKHGGDEF